MFFITCEISRVHNNRSVQLPYGIHYHHLRSTEFTQPMYVLTTLFAMSYCRDGGSGYHMAVAHSYCYELLEIFIDSVESMIISIT